MTRKANTVINSWLKKNTKDAAKFRLGGWLTGSSLVESDEELPQDFVCIFLKIFHFEHHFRHIYHLGFVYEFLSTFLFLISLSPLHLANRSSGLEIWI